jgi:hypothetical protein
MAGNRRRWDRIEAGQGARVLGTMLAPRAGERRTGQLVPVFVVTPADVRHEQWSAPPDDLVWTLRCPRCGKLHRFAPRSGPHPSQCPYLPRMGMTHTPGDWNVCYLARSLAEASRWDGFKPARAHWGTLQGVGL